LWIRRCAAPPPEPESDDDDDEGTGDWAAVAANVTAAASTAPGGAPAGSSFTDYAASDSNLNAATDKAAKKAKREARIQAANAALKGFGSSARWHVNDFGGFTHNTVCCYCLDENGDRSIPASVFLCGDTGGPWANKYAVGCAKRNEDERCVGFLKLEADAVREAPSTGLSRVEFALSALKKAKLIKPERDAPNFGANVVKAMEHLNEARRAYNAYRRKSKPLGF